MLKPSITSITLAAVLLTLVLAAAISILTLAPIQASGVPGSDKTHHFLAFAALTLPLSICRPRLAVPIVFAAIAYGGAIELIQPLVGRSKEFLDFVADAAGSIFGVVVGASIAWLRRVRI